MELLQAPSFEHRTKLLRAMSLGAQAGIYCMRCGISIAESVLLGYLQPFGFPCGYRPQTLHAIAGLEESDTLLYESSELVKLSTTESHTLSQMAQIMSASLLVGRTGLRAPFPVMCLDKEDDYGLTFVEI